MPVSNSDFTNKLASFATPKVELPHVVVAAGDNEVLDQACQSAEAYWMLGWHENEISSVLEDEGFPEDIVKKALEVLTEHAEDLLNEGPFSLLEAGQMVKLANGESGVLQEKRAKIVVLQVGEDLVQVVAEQIDVPATASLTQAFQLRKEAEKNIQVTAESSIVDPETEYGVEPVDTKGIQPEKVKDFTKNLPVEKPGGGDITIVDVQNVKVEFGAVLYNEIKKLMAMKNKLDELVNRILGLQEAHKKTLRPLMEQRSKETSEVQNQAEKVADAYDVSLKCVYGESAYANELAGRFVTYQRKFIEPELRTTLQGTEFAAFYKKMNELVATKSPAIRAEMEKLIAKCEKEVIKPPKESYFERILEIFLPTKTRIGTVTIAQDSMLGHIWGQLASWVAGLWQTAQEIFFSWENEVQPEADQFLAELDQTEAEGDALMEGTAAMEATAAILNHARKRR